MFDRLEKRAEGGRDVGCPFYKHINLGMRQVYCDAGRCAECIYNGPVRKMGAGLRIGVNRKLVKLFRSGALPA